MSSKGETTSEVCEQCGFLMEELQPCHLRCPNCGSHMDCSDKGTVWWCHNLKQHLHLKLLSVLELDILYHWC